MAKFMIQEGTFGHAPVEAMSIVKRTLKDQQTGQDVECIVFLSEGGDPVKNVQWRHFRGARVLQESQRSDGRRT